MAESSKYRDWPPKALEFRALCLPRGEDFGLPSEIEAFNQALSVRCDSRHPAVTYTLREMGVLAYELRRAKSDDAKKMFGECWGNTLLHVSNGGSLPEEEKRIEKKAIPARKATAEKAIGSLKEMFN